MVNSFIYKNVHTDSQEIEVLENWDIFIQQRGSNENPQLKWAYFLAL